MYRQNAPAPGGRTPLGPCSARSRPRPHRRCPAVPGWGRSRCSGGGRTGAPTAPAPPPGGSRCIPGPRLPECRPPAT